MGETPPAGQFRCVNCSAFINVGSVTCPFCWQDPRFGVSLRNPAADRIVGVILAVIVGGIVWKVWL